MSVNPYKPYLTVSPEQLELAEDNDEIQKINRRFLALIESVKQSKFYTPQGEGFQADLISQLEAAYHDACVGHFAKDAAEARETQILVEYGEARVAE
jgi:hypothetical protein